MGRFSIAGSGPVAGAIWMTLAGAVFAAINVIVQYVTFNLGFSSTNTAFWQYLFAMIVLLPWLVTRELSHWKTKQFRLHLLRVGFAALGVQAWVASLAWPVPIWQAIALLMTSPFFVTLGAWLLLGEKVGVNRLFATIVGFVGGMLILEPWSDSFNAGALLTVLASMLWAGTSLCMKRISNEESPEAVTLYLLVLLSPINAFLATVSGFDFPNGEILWFLILGGILTGVAQGCLASAYKSADAAYVQPFDHLKLPLNVFAGWLVFQWVPPGNLWVGAALIVGASLFIMHRESKAFKEEKKISTKENATRNSSDSVLRAFEILGLPANASASEIRSQHKDLAKKLHPDAITGNPKFEELLKNANQAYETLKKAGLTD